MHESGQQAPTTKPRRELYSALMSGLDDHEQGQLEQMMSENDNRLRDAGDGYAP